MIEWVVSNGASMATYQVEVKFVGTEIEMEKTDNVHFEMVNPRICLLGEGRSFRSALLVLWVSQVKNPVIISIVGISLQSVVNSSKGIYNRCGPRKNNLTHTDFDPIVGFKQFSSGS